MSDNQTITITPVGVMRCAIKTPGQAPMNYSESQALGTIEVFAPYLEAMSGLEAGQTLVALCWLHEARRDLLKVYPRGDRSRGLRGVFTTRSPMRPNPIAVSEFTVTKVEGNRIEVTGVDVIDGTPVLDLKSAVCKSGAGSRDR